MADVWRWCRIRQCMDYGRCLWCQCWIRWIFLLIMQNTCTLADVFDTGFMQTFLMLTKCGIRQCTCALWQCMCVMWQTCLLYSTEQLTDWKMFSIFMQIILFIYRNWFANLQDLKNCKNKLPFQELRERVQGTVKYCVSLLESSYSDVIFSCLSSWCPESKQAIDGSWRQFLLV